MPTTLTNGTVSRIQSQSNDGVIAGLIIGCLISIAMIIIACVLLLKECGYCKILFRRKDGSDYNRSIDPPRRSRPPPVIPKPNPLPILNPVVEHEREKPSRPVDNPAIHGCPQAICRQYIRRLGLANGYFNTNYDKCFCSLCYPAGKPNVFNAAGSQYTVPRGWTSFGLQIDQAAFNSQRIFERWFTTFYGTSREDVESIIRNRFIPFSGDTLLDGSVFTRRIADKTHILSSPSVYYASEERFCPTDTVCIDRKWYDVKLVLTCKQYPIGLVKQPGFKANICRIIRYNEIEWRTDQRSATIPYALLIRVQDHRCTRECRGQHSST